MLIRDCKLTDIPNLVKIDREAYGEYGANENYFNQKLSSRNGKILVVVFMK